MSKVPVTKTTREESWPVKYRPQRLGEVVGHENVIMSLRGMLASGKIPPAILFMGPPGSGKTTLARMFARYVNCTNLTLCGECPSCTLSAKGHPDIRELNMADARGIEDMRGLIQSANMFPRFGMRVMILDECHQATPQAIQAFHKPLEEPPKRSLWLLGTMHPDKLPKSIIDRCAIMNLGMVSTSDIVERLDEVAELEGLDYLTTEHLEAIAEEAGGSPRVALAKLEYVSRLVKGKGTLSDSELDDFITETALPTLNNSLDITIIKIIAAIYMGNASRVLSEVGSTSEHIAVVNGLLDINQFVIDKISMEATSSAHTTWVTPRRKRVSALLSKKVMLGTKFLPYYLRVHETLIKLRTELGDFTVQSSYLMTSHLGNLVLRLKEIGPKRKTTKRRGDT